GFSDGAIKVRRHKDDDPLDPKFREEFNKNERLSVMVWGGMGIWGLTDLVYIDGIMDGTVYTEVLKKGLLPYLRRHHIPHRNIYLLEDNDKKHTSGVAKAYKVKH